MARDFIAPIVWKRFAIVAAGPLANFMLAIAGVRRAVHARHAGTGDRCCAPMARQHRRPMPPACAAATASPRSTASRSPAGQTCAGNHCSMAVDKRDATTLDVRSGQRRRRVRRLDLLPACASEPAPKSDFHAAAGPGRGAAAAGDGNDSSGGAGAQAGLRNRRPIVCASTASRLSSGDVRPDGTRRAGTRVQLRCERGEQTLSCR